MLLVSGLVSSVVSQESQEIVWEERLKVTCFVSSGAQNLNSIIFTPNTYFFREKKRFILSVMLDYLGCMPKLPFVNFLGIIVEYFCR